MKNLLFNIITLFAGIICLGMEIGYCIVRDIIDWLKGAINGGYIIILIFILLFTATIYSQEYFLMTSTGYTNHKDCIEDKWFDGKTATNTPIRKGVVAINVKPVKGKWIINSILKLGQKIHIEGLGIHRVEDTGTFSGNEKRDRWTIDIYFDTLEEAKNWGVQLVKVYVIE